MAAKQLSAGAEGRKVARRPSLCKGLPRRQVEVRIEAVVPSAASAPESFPPHFFPPYALPLHIQGRHQDQDHLRSNRHEAIADGSMQPI